MPVTVARCIAKRGCRALRNDGWDAVQVCFLRVWKHCAIRSRRPGTRSSLGFGRGVRRHERWDAVVRSSVAPCQSRSARPCRHGGRAGGQGLGMRVGLERSLMGCRVAARASACESRSVRPSGRGCRGKGCTVGLGIRLRGPQLACRCAGEGCSLRVSKHPAVRPRRRGRRSSLGFGCRASRNDRWDAVARARVATRQFRSIRPRRPGRRSILG
jgi:hypothetical protein